MGRTGLLNSNSFSFLFSDEWMGESARTLKGRTPTHPEWPICPRIRIYAWMTCAIRAGAGSRDSDS